MEGYGERRRLILEIIRENCEVNKIEIYRKIARNKDKCKLLFTKSEHLWCNIPIFYDGYRVESRVIFITKCNDARCFSAEALRATYLMRGDMVPYATIALSDFCDFSYGKAVIFART